MFDKLLEQYIPYIVALVLSVWGGTANYINRINQDESLEFKSAELVGEWIISGFAGLLVYLLCLNYGVPNLLAVVFTGIAGHQGSRTLFVLEIYIRTKIRSFKNQKED